MPVLRGTPPLVAPAVLVVAIAATAGLAAAAMPVLSVTTRDAVLGLHTDAAGVPIDVDVPVPVPVPTRVDNTPRAILEWWGDRGVPGAGVAASAIPDDPLYDSDFTPATGAIPLLPDDSVRFEYGPGASTIGTATYFSGDALATGGLSGEVHEPAADAVADADHGLRALRAGASRAATSRLAFHDDDAGATERLPYAPSRVPKTDGTPLTRAAPSPTVATAASITDGGSSEDAASLAARAALVTAALALPALAVALYHRIRGNSTLDNETRKTIFDAVCGEAGLGVADVAAAARVSYSTASYHLDRLVKERMLVVTADGNKLRYYKNGGAFSEDERRVLPILKNDEAMRVLGAILERPGTYRAQVAQTLGVTATTVNWHLRRLADVGLVTEVRSGRAAALSADHDRIGVVLASLLPKLAPTEAEEVSRRLVVVPVAESAAATAA